MKSKTELHLLQLLRHKIKRLVMIIMTHRVSWVNSILWNKVWMTVRVNIVNLPRNSWKRLWKMMIFKALSIRIKEVRVTPICRWFNRATPVISEDQERALEENGENVDLKTKSMINYRYMRWNLLRVINKLLNLK